MSNKGVLEMTKKEEFISFRLDSELNKKIEQIANFLELDLLPKTGGSKSLAIRLCIEDIYNLFFENTKNEIINPHFNEISKIYCIIKNKKFREALESNQDPEKIAEIVRKFS